MVCNRERFKKLGSILKNKLGKSYLSIQTLQSFDTPMIQFTDLILGIVSSKMNDTTLEKSKKKELINYFEKQLGHSISPTYKNARFFNIFKINLRGSK